MGKPRSDRQANAPRLPQRTQDDEGRNRRADENHGQGAEQRQRIAHQHRRVEQHADRDEEQDSERIAQRQCLFSGALAKLRLVQDHAGDERAQGEGSAEQV